ncbi:DUF6708 domain-containing protein [Burkholderia sp. F1]|uniref:DUF6708 domain-containing protein n=1 Tax=Burkholderia sp. F1 TaxID=3366817 RepID=UPI003D76558F
MARPKLNPPCDGWQRDLPGPHDPVEEGPALLWTRPNHMDDVYLELPRRNSMRWFFALMGAVCAITTIGLLILAIVDIRDIIQLAFDEIILIAPMCLFALCAGVTISLLCSRLAISIPADQPIRFNRLRRKVYVYESHYSGNPYVDWPITTRSYDWDCVRAEAWKQRGATSSGAMALSEGVSLAVVAPSTNDVLDRFQLKGNVQTAMWAYICTYMQSGPHALKRADDEVAPVPNEEVSDVPLLKWIPKAAWPPAMDRESRTAP